MSKLSIPSVFFPLSFPLYLPIGALTDGGVGSLFFVSVMTLFLFSIRIRSRMAMGSAVFLASFSSDISLSRIIMGKDGAPRVGDH